ncbi:MAG: serine/threonine protein kinase [Cognaticolwellia sp.]|jgi:serine/threonine protein kinase
MSHRLHALWSIPLTRAVTYPHSAGLNMGVMKICPKCGKTYADENAAFCFDDGFPLAVSSAPSDSPPVESTPGSDDGSAPSPLALPVPLGAVPEPSVELPRPGLEPLPLPPQLPSNPTLMPMDLDPIPGVRVSLGEHELGDLLALDSESALFDLGQGKAAWIHRPDRPDRQSFVNRVEAAKAARERGVLRVHELGEFKGLSYAVVDRPKGRNLGQLMQRLRVQGVERLDAAEVLDLGTGLAASIGALQAAGLLVGDVHPGRIWVNHEGGTLLLGGVGHPPALPPRAALELWSVQAPELSMRRDQADGRADLFSLGAILWTLLTGRRHTLKSDWVRTVRATLGSAPLDLASPLHELLARCMRAEPAERPESVAVLAKALDTMRGAQRGSWGAKLLTAFPVGSPSTPSAHERAVIKQITGICTGTSAMPAMPDAEALDLPEWPLPESAVSSAQLPVEPEPAAGPGLASPELAALVPDPSATSRSEDVAVPAEDAAVDGVAKSDGSVAGLIALAQKSEPRVVATLEPVPPASEDVQDDDSLGSGFFAQEPAPNDTPLEDGGQDDGLPAPVPQRSWGLALGGALLGLMLSAGVGYIFWSQAQDTGENSPATRPIKAPVEGVELSEPPASGAELVVPGAGAQEEPAAVEPEPVAVEPEPVAVEPEPEPEPAVEPDSPKKETRTRPSGNRPVKGTRPTGNGRSGAAKGASSAKTGGEASGGDAAAKPKEEDVAPEEGWEASPWGEATQGSNKDERPVDANGNPWGDVK